MKSLAILLLFAGAISASSQTSKITLEDLVNTVRERPGAPLTRWQVFRDHQQGANHIAACSRRTRT